MIIGKVEISISLKVYTNDPKALAYIAIRRRIRLTT